MNLLKLPLLLIKLLWYLPGHLLKKLQPEPEMAEVIPLRKVEIKGKIMNLAEYERTLAHVPTDMEITFMLTDIDYSTRLAGMTLQKLGGENSVDYCYKVYFKDAIDQGELATFAVSQSETVRLASIKRLKELKGE